MSEQGTMSKGEAELRQALMSFIRTHRRTLMENFRNYGSEYCEGARAILSILETFISERGGDE